MAACAVASPKIGHPPPDHETAKGRGGHSRAKTRQRGPKDEIVKQGSFGGLVCVRMVMVAAVMTVIMFMTVKRQRPTCPAAK